MAKKIICILFLNSFSLHAAQKNPDKVYVDTMANLGKLIHDKKEKKSAVYNRDSNTSFSMHRSGPRVDGDPEHRKHLQEKK